MDEFAGMTEAELTETLADLEETHEATREWFRTAEEGDDLGKAANSLFILETDIAEIRKRLGLPPAVYKPGPERQEKKWEGPEW